jgi:hypothetical protein
MITDLFSKLLGSSVPASASAQAPPGPADSTFAPPAPPLADGGTEQITPADIQRATHILAGAGVPQAAIGAVQSPAELIQWASSFVAEPAPAAGSGSGPGSGSDDLVRALRDLESRLAPAPHPAPHPAQVPVQGPAPVQGQPGQAAAGMNDLLGHLSRQDQVLQFLTGIMERYIVDQEMAKLGNVGDRRDAVLAKARTLVMAGEDVGEAIRDAAILVGVVPGAATSSATPAASAPPTGPAPTGPTALERLRSFGSPTVPQAGATPPATGTVAGVVQDWGARAEAALAKGDVQAARQIAEQAQTRINEQLYEMTY